jgi:cyclic pyranopterin phosphate synthase
MWVQGTPCLPPSWPGRGTRGWSKGYFNTLPIEKSNNKDIRVSSNGTSGYIVGPDSEKDELKAQPPKMVKDVFGRLLKDLRISVTDRCNFRCTYCMPAEIFGERYQFLPKNEILTFEETARLTRIFVRLGTTKVRLTGGEPLVRSGLEKLVAMLAGIEGIEDLTLTTNGYLLAQKAEALREAGLERVTVSLDSLDDEVFGEMNGRGFGVERVLQGIQKAQEVGLHPIKVNTVVQKGVNDHTLLDLVRHFKGTGVIVRFIEYMDVGNINGWKLDQVVPSAEVLRWINAEMPLEPVDKNYRGEVADRYRYLDGSGEIGFISSVTEAFCSDCTRARLSTDGKLYTCLFSGDGRDLRGPMRAGASDADLEALITNIWGQRTDRYSEIRASLTEPPQRKVEMYQIGG